MANNAEYKGQKKALMEHYSNRILAIFTLGVFNFVLLFYLYRIAMGNMGKTLLMYHKTVYYVLAGCSLLIAVVLFLFWKKDKGVRPFYKENYRYFMIYFAVTAVALALVFPVGQMLGSVNAWVKLYVATDLFYVVASVVYYQLLSHKAVKKIKK